MPAGVAVLTAGVDVQGDRLEVSTWGWGANDESWLVRHEVLPGDPSKLDVWKRLDLVRTRDWQHASGAMLRIVGMAVDSGGHHADEVYRYGKARRKQNVFVIRGGSDAGRKGVPPRPSTTNKARVPLYVLGTIALKDTLYARLRNTKIGENYAHFPWVDEEYFRQLTGEVVRTRYVNKRPKREYVQRYTDVEALDCWVYAWAALLILGPVRDQLAEIAEAMNAGKPMPRGRRRRVRSRGVRR